MSHAAKATPAHALHPSILREYDIRGIAGETLHPADAYVIGQAFATLVAEKTGKDAPVIALGRDGRLSSPQLAESLCQGLQAAGAQVLSIGVGPTPMLYFGVYHLQADAGMMVTGSHNPPTHNGFKIMLGRQSFFGEDIRELGRRIERGAHRSAKGSETAHDIFHAYVTALLDAATSLSQRPLTIAWDAGNGAAGHVSDALANRITHATHHVLNADIDGTFPNHHPDPSVPKNLVQLQETVNAYQCDIGLAFDGDGDRLGAVDDKGRIISSDHLLMLFSRQVLAQNKGATIIADVKTSQSVFDDVNAHGGTALMWKTGHSHIKSKMKEVHAAFAGEASGHIFFADRYYGFDDGLYAALRLIECVAQLDGPLSALIDTLPTQYSTPEIRIDCSESRKFVIIDEVKARLEQSGADFCDIDGVRVNCPQGWWLLRASNTQAAIIARCESPTSNGLILLTDQLTSQLSASGITLSL